MLSSKKMDLYRDFAAGVYQSFQTGDVYRKEGNGVTQSTFTEWQWPLSGVHSIMVKSAQPGEGVGVRPPPFGSITYYIQSCDLRSS